MTLGHRVLVMLGAMALACCVAFIPARADNQTVGLFVNAPGSFDGYTLFAANNSGTTYLIDNEGRQVHSWQAGFGFGAYLLEDGSLIRPSVFPPNPRFFIAGGTGGVQRYAWDGTLLWQYVYSSSQHAAHHDIAVLPNGHVLILAWEYETSAEAIAAGRDPELLTQGQLFPESIIEVAPSGPTSGDIVWEWHVWDHLIQDFDATKNNYGSVADHPELVDVNFTDDSQPGAADWLHANAVDYNPELDQIAISVRNLSEVWLIDHSTTTVEAASHSGGNNGKGGDLLFRWGNPQSYRAGTAADRQFFYQHNVHWIAPGLPGEGHLLAFNNGPRPGGPYSTVDEIVPPVDGTGNYALAPGHTYGPATPVWTYGGPTPSLFYSQFISGADRLPNGNTLIDSGLTGTFFEVTPDGTIVWKYINPVTSLGPVVQGVSPAGNAVFRAYRYAPEYPGLAGRDLTPGLPLETDTDGDGLSDEAEVHVRGTDPLNPDTDSDGLSDGLEVNVHLTNPLNPDTDGDGLPDGLEVNVYHSNPLDPDTDRDGCYDGQEASPNRGLGGGRDPTNFWDFFDTPEVNGVRDGLINSADITRVLRRYGANDAGGRAPINRTSSPLGVPPPFPVYSPAFDRSPPSGAFRGVGPPDGQMTIFDVVQVLSQYGNSCVRI